MAQRGDGIGFLTRTQGFGGTELHTIATAGFLASRGHRVSILEIGHRMYSSASLPGGFTVTPVELATGGFRLPTMYWRDLLDRHRLGTVVVVKGSFQVRWPGLDLTMLTRGGRHVQIEHALPPPPEVWKPGRYFGGLVPGLGLWYLRERAIISLQRRAADRVIAVAHSIKRKLVAEYHYRPEDVTVVHNGVDASTYCYDPEVAARARARWKVPDSAFVFGTICRMDKTKRIDRLLAAFATVSREAPGDSRLVLIGAGILETALRAQAAELGIAGRCVWPGRSSSPWLEYPGFDAFVMTSEIEGLPYSLLEAMACERLAVAMAVSGIGEVLTEGVTGRLVPEDVPAFASVMRDVMASAPEHRAELGARARRHVLDHHRQSRQIEAVGSVILGTSGRPAAC